MKKYVTYTTILSILLFGAWIVGYKKPWNRRTSGRQKQKLEGSKETYDNAEPAMTSALAEESVVINSRVGQNYKPETGILRETGAGRNTEESAINSAIEKVIGTDEKGRTLYEGKRGGH